MSKSYIAGVGSYLPKKVCTNDDLSQSIDTTNDWIYKRTGILQRHLASPEETTSSLASAAAQLSLDDSKVLAGDIDIIIVATTTPDKTFPGCAIAVQANLGCENAFAFDVQAVCSGFIYALTIADSFIKSSRARNVLVIGAEVMSSIVDWSDRSTCILFGDGAGAVVLSSCSSSKNCGIITTHLKSDGNLQGILNTDGGVCSTGTAGRIKMNGRSVYEHAIEKLATVILESFEKSNLSLEDLDWFIPHQANARIIKAVAARIGVGMEKVIMTVGDHANTSAASIPLAMDFAKNTGKLKRRDLVLVAAIGGGLTWGAVLFRY